MPLDPLTHQKTAVTRRTTCTIALAGLIAAPLTPALAAPQKKKATGSSSESANGTSGQRTPSITVETEGTINPYIPHILTIKGTGFDEVAEDQQVSIYLGVRGAKKPVYFSETISYSNLGFVHVPADQIIDGDFETELITGQLWHGQYLPGLEYALQSTLTQAERTTGSGYRIVEDTAYDITIDLPVEPTYPRLEFDQNTNSVGGGYLNVRGIGFERRYIPAGGKLRIFLNRDGLGDIGQLAHNVISVVTLGSWQVRNGAFAVKVPYIPGLNKQVTYTLGVQVMTKEGNLANDALTVSEQFTFDDPAARTP